MRDVSVVRSWPLLFRSLPFNMFLWKRSLVTRAVCELKRERLRFKVSSACELCLWSVLGHFLLFRVRSFPVF